MIELRDVSLAHGRLKLLEGVNTSFGSGCLTALIGRNGSGKSTLLRALAGLDRGCHTGEIAYDGVSSPLSPETRARTVAFVNTSRVRIANMSCADLVALGRAPYTGWAGRLSDDDRRIVEDSLRLTGMEGYASRTLDTMSDGECQRVMIARALAQSTPIILLDEPTSFLDIPNRYQLVGLLQRLARDNGKCIIFSTHELDIAMQMADRIALIDNPRLHNLTPSELDDSGLLQRLFFKSDRAASPIADSAKI